MRGTRGRFRRRLAIAAVVLATVPVLVVALALYRVNARVLDESNRDLLFASIDNVAAQLDRVVADPSSALVAVAAVLGNPELDASARVAAAKQLVAATPALARVGIYDETGARVDVIRDVGVTSTPPAELPLALRPPPTATAPLLGEVEQSPDGLVLPIVMPIRLDATTWFAATTIPLAPLEDAVAKVAASTLDDDTPGALLVVDRQRRVIADGDPEHAAGRLATANAAIVSELARAPGEQVLVYRGYDGPRGAMIGAIRTLPSLPFAVVAQLPRAQAFASLRRVKLLVLAVVLITIAAAAGLALWLAQRMSRPIHQLVGVANDLAARRFDRPVTLKTGDDLELLGDAMRDAGQALAASEQQLREEITIRADLGRFLPQQLVERVVERTQSLELGGQRRVVTVLFANVSSFSSLVDQQQPEAVVEILNQLFTILTELVFRHGGTVDKFIGDSVMAFWNAPDDQPDHARRAVATAVDMMRWTEAANELWHAKHGVTVRLAIGANTGEVVIGNFGSEQRMDYTCIGSAVSLAARLESMARPAQILITRATHLAAGRDHESFPLGPHAFANRIEPVELFEVYA